MERLDGVFGEEMLLWICLLRQSATRPPAEHVHRQANQLLDELRASKTASELPIVSVDDGMFAIAALLDETAMALPDLRPLWGAQPLQATRWMTNNAGVELFERLQRVRQGPKTVLLTYVAVLGMGFLGRFGLPGVDAYPLAQMRRLLVAEVGLDPDRDRAGGTLRQGAADPAILDLLPKDPWWKSIWIGRTIVLWFVIAAVVALAILLYRAIAG